MHVPTSRTHIQISHPSRPPGPPITTARHGVYSTIVACIAKKRGVPTTMVVVGVSNMKPAINKDYKYMGLTKNELLVWALVALCQYALLARMLYN